jgi:transposase
MPSPAAVEIVLTDEERASSEAWAWRGRTANALAVRSRIVLAAAASESNQAIAGRLGVHRNTASTWRRRFAEFRLDGLLDEPRPGQPRKITDAKVEEVITRTLESAPSGATHWSTRSLARELGLSQTAVSRIWRAFGLHPHRQER